MGTSLSGGKPPFLTCSFFQSACDKNSQEGWLAPALHRKEDKVESLLETKARLKLDHAAC